MILFTAEIYTAVEFEMAPVGLVNCHAKLKYTGIKALNGTYSQN
jgi:hypothetical protein